MTRLVFDPFLYLSLAGAAAGCAAALRLRSIKRNRRPMRARRIRRSIVPVVAAISVAAVGAAFLLGASAILTYRIAAAAVFIAPFLLVGLMVLVSHAVIRMLCIAILAAPIGFGALRGLPPGGESGDATPSIAVEMANAGDGGRAGVQELALLLLERRGDELALRLLPVRGVPLAPPDEDSPAFAPPTADRRIPLDGAVIVAAEFVLRPEALWFLGPRALLISLQVEGGPVLARRRIASPMIGRLETILTPEVLVVSTVRYGLPPEEGAFLQEGVLPILLNAGTP